MSITAIVDRVGDRIQSTVQALKPRRLRRRGTAAFDTLVIVPPDLRTADIGFIEEYKSGVFGVDGQMVTLSSNHPFEILDAPQIWLQGVHGFSWLRHLDATGTIEAETLARDLVDLWLQTAQTHRAVSSAPEVVARRVLSWLAHAGLILDSEDRVRYDRFAAALVDDIRLLDRIWRKASPGVPRLIAALARVQAQLSRDGHEPARRRAERDLIRELDGQILGDGSHVSRNPGAALRLMLDLLPLRRCYQAREIPVPVAIFSAMRRIVPFVRFMRHGDGTLANFHGAFDATPDELASVVGFDAANVAPLTEATQSGFVRLAAGETVVIADMAPPPAQPFAADATAGCLAFEISSARARIFSNASSAVETIDTASSLSEIPLQSTLSINGTSSCVRIADPKRRRTVLKMPGAVSRRPTIAGGLSVAAAHAGFADRFGIDHTRHLTLSADGAELNGVDILVRAGSIQPVRHLFAVQFQVDPTVDVRRGERRDDIVLGLRDGQTWVFSADEALLSVEETQGYMLRGGRRLQLVLRGAIEASQSTISIPWHLKRLP
jgi:uncharacterized heparinase superfamily protein